MRFAVGGVSHETSSFTPVPTRIAEFERRHLVRGAELIEIFAGSNTPIGGFIAEAERGGDELVPTLFAEAHPGGPVSRAEFERIVGELVGLIAAAQPLDAIVLDLHGAMVAEHSADCERDILTALRAEVGDDIPIVAQLDFHNNTSDETVGLADILVGRRSYPEVDMGIRGEECVALARRMVAGEIEPRTSFRQLPFVWGVNQATEHEPMASAVAQLRQALALPGVLTASIGAGFPFADAPCMGSSVWVVTDGDESLAESTADALWEWIVERQELWAGELPTTAEALDALGPDPAYPVIFADCFDNTGAGTPGDSTGMLGAFVDADLDDACLLYIVDPESVSRCHEAGVGAASLGLEIGGHSSPDQGDPVELDVTVTALSDGAFVYSGVMYANLSGSMGPSACVRHRGISIVLVTEREQPYDTAFAHTLGLRPEEMRYIGVKSQTHFRAGFESWAGNVQVVREPNVHNPPSGELRYTRVRPEIRGSLGQP